MHERLCLVPPGEQGRVASERTIYSAVGIDLASYGFIVAAVEHRDESASATYYFRDQTAAETGNKTWLYIRTLKRGDEEFPLRNEQVRQRAKECSQALDWILDLDQGKPAKNVLDLEFGVEQLKDTIDKDKIAVMGHSFGGATVVQTLSEDQRFRQQAYVLKLIVSLWRLGWTSTLTLNTAQCPSPISHSDVAATWQLKAHLVP
ncbi:hypothetical protein CB1_001402117 [Camelus ferus]|nr:hypothetical protein CB1_001402117 [Camelus ferus]